MELAPRGPVPLDPFERREEWRFAVLVLALLADHGGSVVTEASVATPAGAAARRRPAAPRRATAAARVLRPPRSC